MLLSLAAAALLASVHVFSAVLRFLREIPRSRLLSLAGGMSVGYVVLRMIPLVHESQRQISDRGAGALPLVEHQAYLTVLLAILLFYGLERAAKRSRRRSRLAGGEDRAANPVFWLHVSMYGLVNLLVGYVLIYRLEERGPRALALFAFAMLLKFVVNDHGLHVDHKEAYDRVGRWLLAAAVLGGWGLGQARALPPLVLPLLQAFIAGGVLFNVLKEELPEERESRYWAFALGALVYGALLLFAV